MKIVKVGAENIQCIRCAVIPLGDGVTIVTGKNGAGKTTATNLLDWLFSPPGGKHGSIVTNGANKGRIWAETEPPTYVIEREFTPEGKTKSFTFKPKESMGMVPSGTVIQQIQAVFETIGMPCFNPREFNTLSPVNRRAEVMGGLGLDIDGFDARIKDARDSAKAYEADANALLNRFTGRETHEGVPESEVDVTALGSELQAALSHNAAIERGNDITDGLKRDRTQLQTQIRQIEDQLVALKGSLAAKEKEIEARDAKAAEVKTVPTDEIESKIADAERVNRLVRENAELAAARAEYDAKEPERARLEQAIKDIEAEKRSALSAAAFPIKEMGFDDFDVTYNGVAWNLASESEQLRGAVAWWKFRRGNIQTMACDCTSLDAERRVEFRKDVEALGMNAMVELDLERAKGETGTVIEFVDGTVKA